MFQQVGLGFNENSVGNMFFGGRGFVFVSPAEQEAASGIGKEIQYKGRKARKRLVIKVAAGVAKDTEMRLRATRLDGNHPGDL